MLPCQRGSGVALVVANVVVITLPLGSSIPDEQVDSTCNSAAVSIVYRIARRSAARFTADV